MTKNIFSLKDKTALITGGGGFLAITFAEALIEQGAYVILADINKDAAQSNSVKVNAKFGKFVCQPLFIDVTDKDIINNSAEIIPKLDILINAAALDPKVKKEGGLTNETRFETMTTEYWRSGIDAILNGTFLCSQVMINKMLQTGGGVVLNIASELAIIAPDQRLYERQEKREDEQSVKPITYVAAKTAMIGMTKYLASYFAKKNIRVNALCPSGIFNDQPQGFIDKISNLIPMGRMMNKEELKGAVAFLCSDASSYMTGQSIILDGGRTII